MNKLSAMKSKWAVVALIFLVWALVASLFAAYTSVQYTDLSNRTSGLRIKVNIGVNYGNGTVTFFNNTQAYTGDTVLAVTKQVTNVKTATSTFGTYVTSINGLAEQGDYGWTYWPLNSTNNTWVFASVGADVYQVVTNGSTFMWYYQNSFNPPP